MDTHAEGAQRLGWEVFPCSPGGHGRVNASFAMAMSLDEMMELWGHSQHFSDMYSETFVSP